MSSLMLIIYLAIILACVAISAFFSAAESALISVQRLKMEHLASTGVKRARRVIKLIETPEKFLSVVLLGNNLVGILAASMATVVATEYFGDQGVIISTIAMTIIILIFGDASPKTIATHNAEHYAMRLSGLIQLFSTILTPVVVVLSGISSLLNKAFGGPAISRSFYSKEEMRTMIRIGSQQGTVKVAEAEILHNVFDLGTRPVREIMVPRTDVIAVKKGAKLGDLLTIFTQTPISRFPVYQDNRDNFIGVVHIKDMLMALANGPMNKETPIDLLIRPVIFTPETKHISELFAEMRDKNYHMAVVVDEYGGTAGVVTLTSLLEEIVGPVGDGFTNAEKEYEIINENTYQVDGSMRVDEANEKMNLAIPEGDYETVAGFILDNLRHIPVTGEQIKFKNLVIIITHMKNKKIEEVRVVKEIENAEIAG